MEETNEVEMTRDDDAGLPEGFYRSQKEVDFAFKKRLEKERRKWEEELLTQPALSDGLELEEEQEAPVEEKTESASDDFLEEVRQQAQKQRELEEKYAPQMAEIFLQEDEFKRIKPEFDLSEELKANPLMATMLASGHRLSEVYDFFHPEEALERMSDQAERQALENIMARNGRPREIFSSAGSKGKDIMRLSQEEMDEIDRRVRAGERVVL